MGEFASYGSSPISGPSPQPPPSSQFPHQGLITVANQFPSSPSPSSPGGTLRQPSTFQTTAPKGWAPVTPPATSPLPNRYQQPPIWQSTPVETPWQQPVTPQQVCLQLFCGKISSNFLHSWIPSSVVGIYCWIAFSHFDIDPASLSFKKSMYTFTISTLETSVVSTTCSFNLISEW